MKKTKENERPMNNDELLLTPLDASRVLGVSTDSVRMYSRDGRLPTMKTVTGRRLFRRSDVDKFAAEQVERKKKKAGAKKQ